MSENNELMLPKKYKRPSFEEFTATPGYKDFDQEGYVRFFENYESRLSEQYAAGEVTDEDDFEDGPSSDEMVDADGDGLPDILHVRSAVRATNNRTLRARQPTRHRFKQYLFADPSKRLVRKRPLKVPASDVRKNLDELIAKEAAGILSVHAPNGQRVDLKALKAGRVSLAPAPLPAPLPNKPLDSAANDVPAGENVQRYLGGTFTGDPIAQQVAADMAHQKQEEADKKGAGTLVTGGSLDPVDAVTGVSTELEQPPVGVDGEQTPVVDQLPKDSEASVEAPTTDPLLEEAAQTLVAEEQDRSSMEDPAGETPKGGSKKGKKGGSK